jgi:CRP-like cAMP-binding protein
MMSQSSAPDEKAYDSRGSEAPQASTAIYQKSLSSDFDEKVCLSLFVNLVDRHGEEGWNAFRLSELSLLARAFTVLSFAKDTTLMKKGETSTFMAVLFKGVATVVVSETIKIPLKEGSILGEMSVFATGKRNADVIASSSEVILALLTYNDLRKLHLISGYFCACL